MAAVSVTGKQCTFTYGALDASAQVTTVSISRTASSETIQTLGSFATLSSEKEITVALELLFDPNESGISELLHTAWVEGGKGTLEVGYGPASSTAADVVVTELGEEVPADGLVTQTATIVTGSADVITWAATP